MTAGPVATQQTPPNFFEKKKKALIPRRAPSMAHGGLFMGQKIFENYCIKIV
jgi:hypothetical protein